MPQISPDIKNQRKIIWVKGNNLLTFEPSINRIFTAFAGLAPGVNCGTALLDVKAAACAPRLLLRQSSTETLEMRRCPPGVFQACSSPRSTISWTDRTARPSRLAASSVLQGRSVSVTTSSICSGPSVHRFRHATNQDPAMTRKYLRSLPFTSID